MTQGVRLTNMLFNHGPGSILETISGPVVIKSWRAMIANLEQEGNRADGPQLSSIQWLRQLEINEPRLSSQLIRDEAKQIRLHALPSNKSMQGIRDHAKLVESVDFPEWHLCRKGGTHQNHAVLFKNWGGNQCTVCNETERSSAIRFAGACNAGHLFDLPWFSMVHKGKTTCKSSNFKWEERSTSTSGIRITCMDCSASTTMSEATQKIRNWPCSREDLSGVLPEVDTCDRSMSVVLRSSTSLWQSDSVTAITIADDEVKLCLKAMEKAHVNFNPQIVLAQPPPPTMPPASEMCAISQFDPMSMTTNQVPFEEGQGSHARQDHQSWMLINHLITYNVAKDSRYVGKITLDVFKREIEPVMKKIDQGEISGRVFLQEWNSIISPRRISACESMTSEFSAMFGSDEPIEWPSKTLPWFKRSGRLTDVQGAEIPFTFGSGPAKVNLRIHEVTKLRAVTALRGFSRPVYDHNGNPAKNVPLGNRYESGEEWYAAVEAQGEGILITFDGKSTLDKSGSNWAKWQQKHTNYLTKPPSNRFNFRGLRREPLDLVPQEQHVIEAHPMFVWWHTLAHHLIRAIQQDTGYSSSAIRERVYAERQGDGWTGGILLYVTEGGMDGTLGGLTSLARNMQRYLDIIAEKSDQCSNDPLCTDTTSSSLPEDRGCYSCTYNSETSCGHRNLFLDRLLMREGVGLQ